MVLQLPVSLANGNPADASEVMQNFNALVTGLGAIRNAQIPEDAAIDYRKMSQRYPVREVVLDMFPFALNQNWAAIAAGTSFYALAAAWTTHARFRVALPSGGVAWLCEAEFYVEGRSNNVATNLGSPQLRVLVDSVVLGGTGVTIDADGAYWRVRNPTPVTAPLLPLNDGSIIELQAQYTAATDRIRGVTARLTIKGSPST